MAAARPAMEYDTIVLGAGCAGLSLCHYLLDLGYAGSILVLDRRATHEDDRTWSFWDVEPTDFSHLATARWDRWKITAGSRTSVGEDTSRPYISLRAADFYEDCLTRLGAAPRVEIGLGEAVVRYADLGNAVEVVTDKATYTAGRVFDARGLRADSPEFELLRTSSVWVPQHFLGQRITASRPVFDSSVCTLMDFGVDQGRGTHFMYVLPTTDREALVENVYFSFARVDPAAHRREIAEYLGRQYGLRDGEFGVVHEERGVIPMSDFSFPRANLGRVTPVGTLAGATRASTGYAFLRIQRECREVAAAFVLQERPARQTGRRRRELLDSVFLRFMIGRPLDLPAVYLRMFERVPSAPLIRFMTERNSLADDLRLILALPKPPFIRIVVEMMAQQAADRVRSARDRRASPPARATDAALGADAATPAVAAPGDDAARPADPASRTARRLRPVRAARAARPPRPVRASRRG